MLFSKSNSRSSEEKLDESSRFLVRKDCQRACRWHLEMLVFIFKTFTLEGKEEVCLSKHQTLHEVA